VAFVIQNVGPTVLGSTGLGLGYQGIDHSVAVIFDISTNSFGLALNGAAPIAGAYLAGRGIDLRSGHDFLADLFYDGLRLHVELTDRATGATGIVTLGADFPAILGGTAAYVGFTGSTAAEVDQFASQHVASFQFQSVPPGGTNQPPLIVRPPRLVAPVAYSPVSLPLVVDLRVRAEDDGGPFDLVYRRELVSGPADVQFEPVATTAVQPDAPGLTAVRFAQPGTYIFRVTVTDAQGLSTATDVTYFVTE